MIGDHCLSAGALASILSIALDGLGWGTFMTLTGKWTVFAGNRSAAFHGSAVLHELVPRRGESATEVQRGGQVNASVIVHMKMSGSDHGTGIAIETVIETATVTGLGRVTVGGKGHETVTDPVIGVGALHHVVLTRLREGAILLPQGEEGLVPAFCPAVRQLLGSVAAHLQGELWPCCCKVKCYSLLSLEGERDMFARKALPVSQPPCDPCMNGRRGVHRSPPPYMGGRRRPTPPRSGLTMFVAGFNFVTNERVRRPVSSFSAHLL